MAYFNNKDDYECHFITNGGDSLERLDNLERVKVEVINFSKGIKNFYYLKNFHKNIKDYCSNSEINIIHTYHRFPEYVAAKVGEELKMEIL